MMKSLSDPPCYYQEVAICLRALGTCMGVTSELFKALPAAAQPVALEHIERIHRITVDTVNMCSPGGHVCAHEESRIGTLEKRIEGMARSMGELTDDWLVYRNALARCASLARELAAVLPVGQSYTEEICDLVAMTLK